MKVQRYNQIIIEKIQLLAMFLKILEKQLNKVPFIIKIKKKIDSNKIVENIFSKKVKKLINQYQ